VAEEINIEQLPGKKGVKGCYFPSYQAVFIAKVFVENNG